MKFPKYLVPLSVVGTIVGGSVLLKETLGGCRYKGEDTLYGRTVVITGATSGIGKESANELAKRGGKIIMACRDMKKCEELRQDFMRETFNKNIHCRKLDLSSMNSIREFADEFNKNEKRCDILINNAGVMGLPKRELTEDGFELQFGVNYLGHFLLTNLLLDKLKTSSPSRIINVTCQALRKGRINFRDLNSSKLYNKREAYMQSKLAIFMSSQIVAENLKGTGVNVYNVHPGIVKTNIGRHMGMNNPSTIIIRPLIWLVFKTPEQGMQGILHCALDPDLANSTGKYYEENCQATLPEDIFHQENFRRLWAISEHWTRLKD